MIYAVYRCLYGEDFIRKSVMSVIPYVDKVFICWDDRPWGDVEDVEYLGRRVQFPIRPGLPFDGWMDQLLSVQVSFPEKLHFIHDSFGTPKNQFTHLVNDRIIPIHGRPDWLVVMEIDHVFRKAQIELALSERFERKEPCLTSHQVELWKDFSWQVPDRPHRKAAMFWDMRQLKELPDTGFQCDPAGFHTPDAKLKAHVHNLGFCVSERTMYWKHLTAIGFSRKIGDSEPNVDWLEKVWKVWKPGDRNLEISLGSESDIPEVVPYPESDLPELLL